MTFLIPWLVVVVLLFLVVLALWVYHEGQVIAHEDQEQRRRKDLDRVMGGRW
jgi:hypothetical protein